MKQSHKNNPEKNPAIEFEPHLDKDVFERDLSERDASLNLSDDHQKETLDDLVERSVWDEPALGGMAVIDQELVSDGRLTYSKWFRHRWGQTSTLFSWMITIGIILCAGPLAVFVAVFLFALSNSDTISIFQIIMITILGPTTEEIAKIVIALWVIEKRPFWFQSTFQILICAVAGGLVFAAIENVFYLQGELFNWENGLTRWRWTVCVLLHTGCCFISSFGLIRIWSRTLRTGKKPELEWGAMYIYSAIIIHGIYNAFAIYLSFIDYQI